jgi:isoamylase
MSVLEEGHPAPLGATWDGRGVNFALFSAHATAVDLCLFDPTGRSETARFRLPGRTDDVWHGYVGSVRPGTLYGYRVHGPYDPNAGHRFNAHKLLLDPYARQIAGRTRWHDALYGFRLGSPRGDLTLDRRDSAPMMPKGIVCDSAHSWGADVAPRVPMHRSIIYEAHVKGLTQRQSQVPVALRGTYDALGHPAVIDHLVKLGITAIELMPIHAFVDDRFLAVQGLRNYWGYSTLGYFAPEPRYLGPEGVLGFKAAVANLHAAGIEVILDVVYNHTAEGNERGPTLSWRGIDNRSYYKLVPGNLRSYWDSTGCGNTLDLAHPRVLQMVLDSLRTWVTDYHIDGFRFDLASTLARQPFDFSARATFLQAVAQDPVLAQVKLIAEPWDLGNGGYQVGGFPAGWSEWSDRFRDDVRAFWRGDNGTVPRLASRLTGSSDLFGSRTPAASVQFVSSHDGFTLHDAVSYQQRHNLANGEENRDGHEPNFSCNYGVEGPTTDPAINAARARHKRNLLATALLSAGTPMLLMGDELSRSQDGNNNAYCQDNETSWLDWHDETDLSLAGFVARLTALRHAHPALRPRGFYKGQTAPKTGLKDIYWLAANACEMTDALWRDGTLQTLGMQIGNDGDPSERFLLLVNASDKPVTFRLAATFPCTGFLPVLDTTIADGCPQENTPKLMPGGSFALANRSLVLFKHVSQAQQ